uniref:Cna B-type domain-containing protein n=1 Tax=Streptococcus sp. TaxID=1306 RepID=UPI0025892C7C
MRKFIRIFLVLLTTLLTLTGISAKAEEDVYYTGYSDGSKMSYDFVHVFSYGIEEDGGSIRAYCFNHIKSRPSSKREEGEAKYRKIADVDYVRLKENCDSDMEGQELYDAIMKVICNGYPNNCSSIKEKYRLKDGDFCAITQKAIWHFTDGVDSDGTGDYIALGALGSKEAWDKSRVKKAYLELIDVANLSYPAGAKLNLYLYDHGDTSGDVQNLITTDVGYTNLSVEKVWDDNDDQDGLRPTSINVQLLANGVEVEGQKIELSRSSNSNWQGVFRGLSLYDSDGNPIEYSVKEVERYSGDLDGYQSTVTNTKSDSGYSYTITNTHVPETTEISGTKTWDDKDNQDGKRPNSITVKLLADFRYDDGEEFAPQEEIASQEVTADTDWKYSFKDLPKYRDGVEISYSIVEEPVSDYETTISGTDITNTHVPETTEISGTKMWDDNDDQDGKRPTAITVNLLADGVKVDSKKVTAADDWKYEFKDLPKYKAGQEIKYSVTEEAVKDYETKVSGTDITNIHTPETTDISGTKTWDDNDDQDGKRPNSITVNLLANGTVVDAKTVTADNDWNYAFTDLPKYDNGNEIVYTVTEDAVEGYTSSVEGTTITNTHAPETVDVKATKNWDDGDNQDGKRPTSITINLLADGEKVASKEVTAADDGTWTAEFTNLAKYKDGKEITYTITEDSVTEYETTITDFDIINKYTPKAIEYQVTKVWDDNNDQDGKRPDSVTVQLYKSVNGSTPVAVEGKTLTITADDKTDDNTWIASFTNLPQFEKGQEITYSVQETDVADGYTASVSGQMITNSHTPDTVVISGTKVWDDNNNQDGKRTATVTVQILKGETVVDEIEVSESDDWSFTSKELPKYENGQEIAYTVKEIAVENYTTKAIEQGEDGKYTIVNEHTPEKITLSGEKIWNDANNQDGIRPESITVHLLANGEETGQTATASEATGWKYEFADMDRYKDGQEIVYSVVEDEVDDYTSQPTGMNVTNSHEPETISVSGGKTWSDNDDQDGIRPDSITIELLANGESTGNTQTVSADTNWEYTFKDVPKYANGQEVTYTVREVNIPDGYTSSVDGTTITNTHTPETTEVSGTKTWADNDDQDGKRPASITVNLLANGTVVDTKTVTADDNWSYS